MANNTKYTEVVYAYVTKSQKKRLEKYCEMSELSQTFVARKALEKFLDKVPLSQLKMVK